MRGLHFGRGIYGTKIAGWCTADPHSLVGDRNQSYKSCSDIFAGRPQSRFRQIIRIPHIYVIAPRVRDLRPCTCPCVPGCACTYVHPRFLAKAAHIRKYTSTREEAPSGNDAIAFVALPQSQFASLLLVHNYRYVVRLCQLIVCSSIQRDRHREGGRERGRNRNSRPAFDTKRCIIGNLLCILRSGYECTARLSFPFSRNILQRTYSVTQTMFILLEI